MQREGVKIMSRKDFGAKPFSYPQPVWIIGTYDENGKADRKLIEKNLKVLEALQKSYFIDKVWAAWGDLIDSRDYLGNTLYDIQDTIKEAEWYHLGTTTRWGNPRHPLYLKGDSEFQWFPVFDYACECRDGDIW
jgi:hypothetical protein